MSATVQRAAVEVTQSGLAAVRILAGLSQRLKDQFADDDGLAKTCEAYRIAEMVDWVAERLSDELTEFRARTDKAGWL